MKCPLLSITDHERHGNAVTSAPDCLGEECAEWDHQHGVCSVKVIKKALIDIAVILARIADKMPPHIPKH